MKLYKKSERTIKTEPMLSAYREGGFETTNIGTYCKWKELQDGRVQVKMTVYKVAGAMTVYMMSDTLGRVAAPMTEDLDEVKAWLTEHGYKPEKQWYMEDYGMDEETWNAWNGAE